MAPAILVLIEIKRLKLKRSLTFGVPAKILVFYNILR